ncbi:uncharacterized protein K02A2.6-like [Scyliorhinus canicula]|uniref:uncharacterized protein K02A2.6-like n=1 Tax=Scyliorhinus canicula TaxID=7830 RepID=UPI0018F41636|nr:uncharacterized protein K02A2.6-like [Scyliorhinus canicula]
MSDNGPYFNSWEWTEFTTTYKFRHITSNPPFPQSNGKVEKGINIMKQLLSKARDTQSDFYLALLIYRSSPLTTGLSPVQILFNWNIRSTLPQLHIPDPDQHDVVKKLHHQRQKQYYDQHAKNLKPLEVDDDVRIRFPEGGDVSSMLEINFQLMES